MGRVFLARQEALKRLVCVKVLSIQEGHDADLYRARFCREAEILASVSHPNVLSVYDFGMTVDADLPYLVTEYVEGGDLRGVLDRGQRLPPAQVRSIVRQVSEALRALHERGILHRDLKPENILGRVDSLLKVGDFGIAVARDQTGSMTRTSCGMGTVGYAAPEQQYGLKVDERSDQYSLAAVTYELLTGRRPLGLFPPPSVLNPRLTRAVDAVVLRGLAEEREARYPSVQHFAVAFDRAMAGSPRIGRRTILSLTVLLAVLLATAGLAWMTRAGAIGPTEVLQWVRRGFSPSPQDAGAATAIQNEAPAASRPEAPSHTREFHRHVELRAYRIWEQRGRPQGPQGDAAAKEIWNQAEQQILDEVNVRAYRIWEGQGRPQGAAGEAVREKNFHAAEVELLRELEGPTPERPAR
jgi:serine/threonine protein kinase